MPRIEDLLVERAACSSQSGSKADDTKWDAKSLYAFWSTRHAMIRLRAALQGVIICRDSRSVDCQGRPLLGLSPKLEITSHIKLDAATETLIAQQSATKEQQSVYRFFTCLYVVVVLTSSLFIPSYFALSTATGMPQPFWPNGFGGKLILAVDRVSVRMNTVIFYRASSHDTRKF
jgi:hypothetical protein